MEVRGLDPVEVLRADAHRIVDAAQRVDLRRRVRATGGIDAPQALPGGAGERRDVDLDPALAEQVGGSVRARRIEDGPEVDVDDAVDDPLLERRRRPGEVAEIDDELPPLAGERHDPVGSQLAGRGVGLDADAKRDPGGPGIRGRVRGAADAPLEGVLGAAGAMSTMLAIATSAVTSPRRIRRPRIATHLLGGVSASVVRT